MIQALLGIMLLAAALPVQQLDSELVVQRYARTLLHAPSPRVLVFTYTVSQAGPPDIEQTHRIYRSEDLVRDETLLVDGVREKSTRIARYRNRYTLANLAPRLTEYTFLFDGAQRSGSTLQYAYRAIPNGPAQAFSIDSIVIDGRSYLPSVLHFHSSAQNVRATGTVTFGRSGKYWVPQMVSVAAGKNGKGARERIVFSSYRFPLSLPKSTFQAAKPLPSPTPPAF